MKTTQKLTIASLVLIALVTSAVLPAFAAASGMQALPVTGAALVEANAPAFAQGFAASGETAGTVTRVVVTNLFDYSVVQNGNVAPLTAATVGQYAFSAKYNNVGLIAHDYLAGGSFYQLTPGMEVEVYYSDGGTETYVITSVSRYQATNPNDYGAPFIDPNGVKLSAFQVFTKAYLRGGLTFQTCISTETTTTWGLLFVQAIPKGIE